MPIHKCKICRKRRPEVMPTGTGLCDNCWEINRRLTGLDLRTLIYFFYTVRELVWEKEV